MTTPWRHMPAEEHRTIRLADDRRLGFVEYCDRRSRSVLYFHGLPGSHIEPRAFHHAATRFGRTAHRRRPARHGPLGLRAATPLSDWPADITQLADLIGLDQFAIIGLSGGGP
jgi:pimeloyl-ACP methyl ester carboxylesterase